MRLVFTFTRRFSMDDDDNDSTQRHSPPLSARSELVLKTPKYPTASQEDETSHLNRICCDRKRRRGKEEESCEIKLCFLSLKSEFQ